MTDIRTTSEEFSTSGSLLDIENKALTDENETDRVTYHAIKFLQKKVDELVNEVNILKNQ